MFVLAKFLPWSAIRVIGQPADTFLDQGEKSCGVLLVYKTLEELKKANGEQAEYFELRPKCERSEP